MPHLSVVIQLTPLGRFFMSSSMQNTEPMMTKKDVAKFLQCSERQVELLVKAGKIPKPFYFSKASPRWRRSAIDEWVNRLDSETNCKDLNN